MGKNQNKYSKNFFFNSLSVNVVIYCPSSLNKEEFDFLAKKINWDKVSDNLVNHNYDLLKKINWGKHISKARAIRIATSLLNDQQDISIYPLHEYEFHFKELIHVLQRQPSILQFVNIIDEITVDQVLKIAKKKPEFLTMYDFDVKNATSKQMLELMKVGNEDFNKSINFDLTDLPQSDRFKMIKSSGFKKETIKSSGAFKNDFNNPYYIREIIVKTGEEYIEDLNIEFLSANDWVKILRSHRHMYKLVDVEKLLLGDIYNLIQICMFIPEFVHLIDENNVKKITSRGWEKLLVKYGKDNDSRLINLCDFSKIEQRSWNYIQKEKPELLIYRL